MSRSPAVTSYLRRDTGHQEWSQYTGCKQYPRCRSTVTARPWRCTPRPDKWRTNGGALKQSLHREPRAERDHCQNDFKFTRSYYSTRPIASRLSLLSSENQQPSGADSVHRKMPSMSMMAGFPAQYSISIGIRQFHYSK